MRINREGLRRQIGHGHSRVMEGVFGGASKDRHEHSPVRYPLSP